MIAARRKIMKRISTLVLFKKIAAKLPKSLKINSLFLVLSLITFTTVLMWGNFQNSSSLNALTQTTQTPVTINRYEAPKMDRVNLYWIETNEGIVLVDTGRFLSQARYALEEIRSHSNKPIVGILITHPHTDHYGGLPVFAEAAVKNVPIYASQITYDDIRTDGQGFIAARNELHGNDFPDRNQIPLPNSIVKNGDEISLGGLKFQVIDLPKNETIDTTLYYLREQKALFAGDFVVNGDTPFLGDGFTANWLVQLQMVLKQYPNVTIYHGHGEPGEARPLIEAQSEYIETVRNLVSQALATGNEVTPEEKADIVTEIEAKYPDYWTSMVLPGLLEAGIDGVAKELKQQNQSA